jgi:hypothetical protein
MKSYYVQAFDDVVSKDLADRVWKHIQEQKFHATRKDKAYPEVGTIVNYVPADGKKEYLDKSIPSVNNQYMHRCVFGNTRTDLMEKHSVIDELWEVINNSFEDKFVINGDPEGIADNEHKIARVYVNAQPQETIKRSHAIHRDTIDMDQEKNFTLLYFANPVWYPSWMAENMFFFDDEETGDSQQFQKGHGQSREFPVGWPYATVCPKPGRILIYDGRALHTTKPASAWAEEMRYAVVFRIKLKG